MSNEGFGGIWSNASRCTSAYCYIERQLHISCDCTDSMRDRENGTECVQIAFCQNAHGQTRRDATVEHGQYDVRQIRYEIREGVEYSIQKRRQSCHVLFYCITTDSKSARWSLHDSRASWPGHGCERTVQSHAFAFVTLVRLETKSPSNEQTRHLHVWVSKKALRMRVSSSWRTNTGWKRARGKGAMEERT